MNVLPAIRADHGSTLWYYCDPTKNSPSEGFLVMFNVESGSLDRIVGCLALAWRILVLIPLDWNLEAGTHVAVK